MGGFTRYNQRLDKGGRPGEGGERDIVFNGEVDDVVPRVKDPRRAGIGDKGDGFAFLKELEQILPFGDLVVLVKTRGRGLDPVTGKEYPGVPYLRRRSGQRISGLRARAG
jgi:hypothetical protein